MKLGSKLSTKEIIGNHIHVEASKITPIANTELWQQLQKLGFEEDDFLNDETLPTALEEIERKGFDPLIFEGGNPPMKHYTKKFLRAGLLRDQIRSQKNEFAAVIDQVVRIVDELGKQYRDTICGYVEAEHVIRYTLDAGTHQPFQDKNLPFALDTKLSTNKGADMHLNLGLDADPSLVRKLVNAGLYAVAIRDEKEVSPRIILTAQGTVKQIKQLCGSLVHFLQEFGGGGSSPKLKMEVVAALQRTSDDVQLSHVINSIQMVSSANETVS